MNLRFEYVTGGFQREVYSDLGEPRWFKFWQDGPQDLVVAHDGGEKHPHPIGIIRVFSRNLRWSINGSSVIFRVAGIGGVWVHPDYRGKDVGFSLLVATLGWLRTRSHLYDLAVLFSKKPGGGIYSKAGFKDLGRDLWVKHLHNRYRHFEGEAIQGEWKLDGFDF